MKQIIRLTEGDLHRIVRSSVKKIIREYTGDEEALGRYDIDDEKYDMPDEEYDDLQRLTADDNEKYESDMQEFIDGNEGYDEWVGRDYYDPSPMI